MTVGELIASLSDLPLDIEVFSVTDGLGRIASPIGDVTIGNVGRNQLFISQQLAVMETIPQEYHHYFYGEMQNAVLIRNRNVLAVA